MSVLKDQPAPAFTLPDETGAHHSLSDYRGSWVVLYFYPKDDTPGCTTEACGFRDAYQQFAENHIIVLGVSKDPVSAHRRFREKYDLPFTLLSDESKEVIKTYQAWGEKKFMGKTFEGILRITYLIDPEGSIRKVYEKVKPADHAAEILADIASFRKH